MGTALASVFFGSRAATRGTRPCSVGLTAYLHVRACVPADDPADDAGFKRSPSGLYAAATWVCVTLIDPTAVGCRLEAKTR